MCMYAADNLMPVLVKMRVFLVTDPPQVLLLIIDRIEFLIARCPDDVISAHVLPVLLRALGLCPNAVSAAL